MQLTIDADPKGGLRLVRAIPLHRLGRLEGFNGIGKSAALRLLQVCAGDQPYLPEEQPLWTSFRQYVGRCVVTLTGLTNDRSIVWALDPDQWPNGTDEPIRAIGRITVDGVDVELEDVRRLLRVDRVVGNEGLVPTLIRELKPHRAALDKAFGAQSVLVRRQGELDALLYATQEALNRIIEPPIAPLEREVTEQRAELRRVTERARSTAAGSESLNQALRLSDQLDRLVNDGGGLERRATELAASIGALENGLKRLDDEIAAAGARAQAEPGVTHELELARRNADRTAKIADEAHERVRAAVRVLGLDGEPLQIDAVALLRETATRRGERSTALAFLFVAPRVADLGERLTDLLDGAGDDLDDAVLLERDVDHTEVTVAQLRARLTTSTAHLRAADPPDRAIRLRLEIDDLDIRLRLLSDLRGLQDEAKKRQGLSDAAQVRLQRATEALAALSGERVADLVSERERMSGELREAAIARADAVRARAELGGGLTSEQLQRRLQDALAQADTVREDLAESAATARTAAAEASQHLTTTEDRLRRAMRSESAARESVQAAIEQVRADRRFEWVAGEIDSAVARADLNSVQAGIRELVGRIETVRARANATVAGPQGVIGALGALETDLAQPVRQPGDERREILAAVRAWFGREVSAWFNQPLVREVLFEGANLVQIDLLDMSVTWTIGDDRFARPLTAFSSGEQAFAYTRARLAVLDSEHENRDRIVALDEFGAFMARNWLYRLESYLSDRATSHPADRVLLVLPLTRTTEELQRSDAPSTTLELAEQQGYFVRELSKGLPA